MPDQRPQQLEPRVRNLVASDRQMGSAPGLLPPELIDVVIAVARGEENFDAPVSAANALRALAEHARADVAVPVLEDAVLNDARPLADRIVAAQALGDVGDAAAQRALLRAARADEPALQQAAFESLGRFAGLEAAEELSDTVESTDAGARRQLAFARALVAHRYGAQGPTLPEEHFGEGRLPAGKQTNLAFRVKPARETVSDLRRLRGTTWGMEVADRALSLRCGSTDWEILLNRRMGLRSVLPTSLLDRPWIAAVLAQWIPTGERLTTRYVVLTRPLDTGAERVTAHVDVVRADGSVVYTGTARPSADTLDLEIGHVEPAGTAPVRLSARITAEGVDLRHGSALAARVGVRVAEPIQLP